MGARALLLSLVCPVVLPLGALAVSTAPPPTPETELAADSTATRLEDELAALLELTSAAPRSSSSASDGVSRALNPAISVNGLFMARAATEVAEHDEGHVHEPLGRGLFFQEIELRMTSWVDPYAKADFVVVVEPEEVALEEAHVTLRRLPRGLGARVGVLKPAFGKHLSQHLHNFPLVLPPRIQGELFGMEVHGDAAVELSWLAPLPYFLETTFQVSDGALFASPDDADLGYLARLRNLWAPSESTTIELSGSWLQGRNETLGWTRFLGADLTLQWAGRSAAMRKLIWQNEFLWEAREEGPGQAAADRSGVYSDLSWRIDRRWWLQGRVDLAGLGPEGADSIRWGGQAQIAFVPSEFQTLRLSYHVAAAEDHEGSEEDPVHGLQLQYSVTIGSHPAHAYR